ncbi:MAG: sulfotransferase domain-containing protein [Planctomycetes bacterium]|nr:sulfotransferase domain-containing protein [Planctomycetota bacterium]
MVIWLASYPRSGNHFFRHALHALYGVSSHSIYREKPLRELYGDVKAELNRFQLEEMDRRPEPVFVKTHEMPGDDRYPAVYLIRDGRDALVSFAHYSLKEQPKGLATGGEANFKKTLGNLILYQSAFGGWASHVTAWSARPNTAIVRFDDLVSDTERSVREALRALDLDLPRTSGGVLKTFEQLRKESPANFRRGRSGSWKEEMPKDLHALFCFLCGDVLRRFGYREGMDDVPMPEHQEIRGLVVKLQHALDEERRRNTVLRSEENRRALFDVIEQHRMDLYGLRRRYLKLRGELRKALEVVELAKPVVPPKSKVAPWWKSCLTYPVLRVKGIFAPRIGVLRQHGPKPMRPPPAFREKAPVSWPKISVVTPSFNQKLFLL